jgi:predicted ribosome quality control (RQC) complex YloA/Tae2 family protein
MEISAIEIHLLCGKISESIKDYFVSGIYSMEEGALFRLNHSTKPEKLIAVSSFANWMTTKNLSVSQATGFVSRVRVLERFALLSVEQVGNERIAKYSFKSRKGENRNLYAEFFAQGNLVLTDPDQADLILDVEKPQSFRHRNLQVGEKYALPPTRGVPLQDIDKEKLVSIHSTTAAQAGKDNLSAVRWFGRNIGTSRKFVEEIFFRANIDPNLPSEKLNTGDLEKIAMVCEILRNDLRNSEAGFILVPLEDSDLDIDVCPIIPNSWKLYEQQKLATISSFPSLSDALDEVLVQAIVLERRRSVSKKTRAKAAELSSALAKQATQIESNKRRAEGLRIMAKSLMSSQLENLNSNQELVSKLISYDVLELSKESANQARFLFEPRSFLKSYTGTALGSRLFDEAKRLDSETRNLEDIMRTLEEQKESLVETTRSQEEKAERKLITERRERQWFERYRWFVTSDGRLALGGRDSTSNSIVINKYTGKNDIVFHADLHGSPFFILRNEGNETANLSEEIALEMAQSTVSFSRAWKDELGSADAYWVTPDQIKKSAPSGEYLPRGSFFIEGKKNFIRHVKTELAVGIMSSGNLPTLDKPSNEESVPDSGSLLVVCGPEKSISGYCHSHVKIGPGREKGTMFARKLKQQLVNKIKDSKVKEASKKLPLDEVLRVLPSGGYKFILEKQNN